MGPPATQVSIFAYIGWKLETSGNETGNEIVSRLKKCTFVGKIEDHRKLAKSALRKLRPLFRPSEISSRDTFRTAHRYCRNSSDMPMFWNHIKAMFNKIGFETIIASPPEHDGLVAEIYFDEKFVALINQEKGFDDFEIEFAGPNLVEDVITRKVHLRGFLEALEVACKRLRGEIR